jgi:hypothetical protein
MKSKKITRIFLTTLTLIGLGWLALTIYVERKGPAKRWTFANTASKKALVVFDPDPFYDLDEQICLSFAGGLAARGLNVTVASVASADTLKPEQFDLVVYCANTYNWRPDWVISHYVERHRFQHEEKPVVAITLGAGSTDASKIRFERLITACGGKLIESHTLWLWRPNDKTKMDQPNIRVALTKAHAWGEQTAQTLTN